MSDYAMVEFDDERDGGVRVRASSLSQPEHISANDKQQSADNEESPPANQETSLPKERDNDEPLDTLCGHPRSTYTTPNEPSEELKSDPCCPNCQMQQCIVDRKHASHVTAVSGHAPFLTISGTRND